MTKLKKPARPVPQSPMASFAQWMMEQERKRLLIEVSKALSTNQLKDLWDSFKCEAKSGERGYFWPTDGLHLEEVHQLLNQRGEGAYCAV